MQRLHLHIRGLVQGVGFRPHVFRIAHRHQVAGWVRNDAVGVLIEVEAEDLTGFLRDLVDQAPSIARIDRVESHPLPPLGESGFTIQASQRSGSAATGIGADLPVCRDCLAELFDPGERRYLYPFLSCTQCGPRYTVTARLPYDRAQTALAGFPLCPACAAEYADPAGRRFHAEPMACPQCGPRLDRPVPEIVARLRAGEILALKGIGGFHLVCDARQAAAVARLRAIKQRDAKPLAVMVANLASARALVDLDPAGEALLSGPARPIVIAPLRPEADSSLAPGVSNGLGTLGVMLPYAPLHWLLFHEAAGAPFGTGWTEDAQDLVLVMSSANRAGEPIVIDEADAVERLGAMVDAVVGHDRPILARADDSVLRVVAGGGVFIRRARGFVPEPIRLPRPVPPILAVGAAQKITLCLTRGDEAFLSTHVGDAESPLARAFFSETVARLCDLLDVEPQAVVHDLHPDFFTSLWAAEWAATTTRPALAVQHHHAHLAAIAGEYGIATPLVGVILDGYGMGIDGGAWGGERLRLTGGRVERLGSLAPLALPGGDAAARAPWRMAAAALHRLGRGAEIATRFADHPGAAVLAHVLARGTAPLTSSAGRWFDAAAGLLGLAGEVSDEALAAMCLESLVRDSLVPDSFVKDPTLRTTRWTVLLDGTLDLTDLLASLDPADPVAGASRFHGTLAAAVIEWVVQITAPGDPVALGGGCFLNRWLSELILSGLTQAGRRPLLPRRVPPGDGGLALGQAWLGALRLEEGAV